MYKRCELILKELESEGKIKVWWDFKFPEKEPLKLRLKDMLEDEVDEKYYLSDKMIAGFIKHNENHKEKGTGFIWKPKDDTEIANTLRANAALCATDNTIKVNKETNVIGHLEMDKWQDHMKRIYDVNSYAPTLGTMQGGNTEPKILDDTYGFDKEPRVYEETCPTIRSERQGLKIVESAEKQVERTPLKFLNRNQKNIEGDYAFCVDCSNTGGIKEIYKK